MLVLTLYLELMPALQFWDCFSLGEGMAGVRDA